MLLSTYVRTIYIARYNKSLVTLKMYSLWERLYLGELSLVGLHRLAAVTVELAGLCLACQEEVHAPMGFATWFLRSWALSSRSLLGHESAVCSDWKLELMGKNNGETACGSTNRRACENTSSQVGLCHCCFTVASEVKLRVGEKFSGLLLVWNSKWITVSPWGRAG